MKGELPSIPERMYNLTKTSIEVLKGYIFEGEWEVPDEIYKHRLKVCESCDLYIDHPTLKDTPKLCQKCGCNMTLKARYAAAECPMDYFPKYKENIGIHFK